MASLLIRTLFPSPSGYWTIPTFVILPVATTICTCTLPYLLLDADPVKVPSRRPVALGAAPLPALVELLELDPDPLAPDAPLGPAGTVASGIDELLDDALVYSR